VKRLLFGLPSYGHFPLPGSFIKPFYKLQPKKVQLWGWHGIDALIYFLL